MALIRSSMRWLPLLLASLLLSACFWWGPPREYTIKGTVMEENGNPLADVLIYATGQVEKSTGTDEQGRYILPGLKGTTVIRPELPGWVFLPPYKQVHRTSTVDFTAVVGAVLSGTIAVEHSFPRSVVDPFQVNYRPQTVGVSWPAAESPDWYEMDFEPSELIIAFEESVSAQEQLKILEDLGLVILDRLAILNAYLVQVPDRWEQGLVRALSAPGIKYAEPNGKVLALGVVQPNDELYGQQWHYPLIRLPQAWSVVTGDTSIRIAVVDSGVKKDHPELAAKLDHRYGYNFVAGNDDFDDDYGHGTHVAGTIGAATNNRLGVAGVMWDVELLPVKVLNERGRGGEWELVHGLLYAAGLLDEPDKPRNPYPADVINLSLGSRAEMVHLRDAVERISRETNCILVAAAGNGWGPGVYYPARYPEVIAVGAVDYNYPHQPQRTRYSSYGPGLDVMAPGGDIHNDTDGNGEDDGVLSTAYDGDYGYKEGTSMATPHISGVIGLMLAAGIPPQQVREILQAASMPLGPAEFSEEYGYGLINAYWAVNAVEEMRLVVGRRTGNRVEVVKETTLPAKGGSFELIAPPGEYQIMAWVDVQRTGDVLEPGDYFNESDLITLESGKSYTVSGTILELDSELTLPPTRLLVVEAGAP